MHFSDTTFSLAKALHHINNAREYFTDVKRDCHSGIKNQFSNYIQKCDFIIDSVTCKLTAENKAILKKELADSFLIEGINDKLMLMNELQRNEVENLIEQILKRDKK
jgi:ribosomal protein S8